MDDGPKEYRKLDEKKDMEDDEGMGEKRNCASECIHCLLFIDYSSTVLRYQGASKSVRRQEMVPV